MESNAIFNHYKERIINEGAIYANTTIRFNVIQHTCNFPGINPVIMAASLMNDGFTIAFDDRSISCEENAKNKRKVKLAATGLLFVTK